VDHFQLKLRTEQGATLPELLIALVLTAMTAGLVGTAIYQFFVVSNDGNDRMIVLHNLQNASTWLGRDTNESQSFTPGSGDVYGTLTTGDTTVEYRYSYDSTNKALIREHLVSSVVQSTMPVARRIANQNDVSFSINGSLLSVSITTTSVNGSISESTTLKLALRVK
jgi:hypothetical protein